MNTTQTTTRATFSRSTRVLVFIAVVSLVSVAAAVAADGGKAVIRPISPNSETGTSAAVLVSGSHLAHTTQILPLGPDGSVTDKGDAGRQAGRCLELLDGALRDAGSELGRVVKLHICVASQDKLADVRQVLALRFSASLKPAVTMVVSSTTHPEALVAMDAVAATDTTPSPRAAGMVMSARLKSQGSGATVAILPEGARAVYVSGQSGAGDLIEGTRRTLDSLKRTIEFLGVKVPQIVQLKAFMAPATNVAVVRTELAKFFGTNTMPPLVIVEWVAPQPIEIEMIATTGDLPASVRENVSFATPPGMPASPVFSRVAVLNRGPTIYIGGMHGVQQTDANAQVRAVFASLEGVLKEVDGSMRHLLKATYYVTDDASNNELNRLRPGYFDPRRPPAASKATVRGVGAGRTVTVDMIATPVR